MFVTVNRSILNIYGENVKSVASHMLLQPVRFKMDLSISLSPDVTSVPLTQLNANLGSVKVFIFCGCVGVIDFYSGVAYLVGQFIYLYTFLRYRYKEPKFLKGRCFIVISPSLLYILQELKCIF